MYFVTCYPHPHTHTTTLYSYLLTPHYGSQTVEPMHVLVNNKTRPPLLVHTPANMHVSAYPPKVNESHITHWICIEGVAV